MRCLHFCIVFVVSYLYYFDWGNQCCTLLSSILSHPVLCVLSNSKNLDLRLCWTFLSIAAAMKYNLLSYDVQFLAVQSWHSSHLQTEISDVQHCSACKYSYFHENFWALYDKSFINSLSLAKSSDVKNMLYNNWVQHKSRSNWNKYIGYKRVFETIKNKKSSKEN